MSYDLNLHRQDKPKAPLQKADLKKLKDKFDIVIQRSGEDGSVLDFAVKYKADNPEWLSDDGFTFHFQEDGRYWTYISYSADDEMFDYFRKLARDISEILHFTIQDPQIGNEIMTPEEFTETFETGEDVSEFAKKLTEAIARNPLLQYAGPASSKYFTKFIIVARESETGNNVMLMMNGDQLYCNKVEKGEHFDEVILRDLEFLTGSKDYLSIDVKDGGYANDRHGNQLPRKDIIITVPFFDPRTRNLPSIMSWRTI